MTSASRKRMTETAGAGEMASMEDMARAFEKLASEMAETRSELTRIEEARQSKNGNGNGNGNGKRGWDLLAKVIQALLIPILIGSGALQIKLMADIRVLQETVFTQAEANTMRADIMNLVRDRLDALPTAWTRDMLADHEARIRAIERVHRIEPGSGGG